MTGMSGSNTPPDDFPGYRSPTSGPSGGPNPHVPDVGIPPNPVHSGNPYSGGQIPGMPPTPAAARAAPATRPITRSASRRGRARTDSEGRDPNQRFQGLIAAIGLAIGLLFIVGGGLLNANTSRAGLDPTASAGTPRVGRVTSPSAAPSGALTPTTLGTATVSPSISPTTGAAATVTPQPTATATTRAGTATPTATAIPAPAKLSISPSAPIQIATCSPNTTLTTLNLSNSGSQGLDWTAAVDPSESANVTLSDSTGTITGGHLNSGGTDSVSVNNISNSAITNTPFSITFTTTPTAAGPVTVKITCA